MFQYNPSGAGAYLHNQEYTLQQETALCTYNIFTSLQACTTFPMNYYYYAT